MGPSAKPRSGLLEALLALAVVALVLQLFPSLGYGLLRAVDVRQWSRGAWLGLNVAVVFGLFVVRFGPGLLDDWRGRRQRLAGQREKQDKQLAARQQRQMLQRIKDGRRRRLY